MKVSRNKIKNCRDNNYLKCCTNIIQMKYCITLIPLQTTKIKNCKTNQSTTWESDSLPTTKQLRQQIVNKIFKHEIQCDSVVLYLKEGLPLAETSIKRIKNVQIIFFTTNNETKKENKHELDPKQYYEMLLNIIWAPTFHVRHVDSFSKKLKESSQYKKLINKYKQLDYTCIVFAVCHCPLCEQKKLDPQFMDVNMTNGKIISSFTTNPRAGENVHRIYYNGIKNHFTTGANKENGKKITYVKFVIYYNNILAHG